MKKLTPLKFLACTSHTSSSKIQYKLHDNQTFTPLMNVLSDCSTTINFARLMTLSSILTAAVT